jgi:dTDP-4-amino-4,6-dideoxygalactose transaminase
MIENTKKSILGYQLLIAEDFSTKDEVISKVKYRISRLQLLEDDEEAIESIKILNKFLKDCELYNKKMEKLEDKENIFLNVLRTTDKKEQREYILNKLKEIDNEKINFV